MSTAASGSTPVGVALHQNQGGAGAWVRGFGRFMRKKPLGAIGAMILITLIATAILSPFLATVDPNAVSGRERLQAPSLRHFFGTDEMGRDIYSRVVAGARLSVGIGVAATTMSILIAGTIGMFSAYREGKTDLFMQRIVDGWISIPTLIILMASTVVLGRGVLTLILLIGLFAGMGSSRVVRSATLTIKRNDYVTAAMAIGATDARIILRHILPNIFAPIMVIATVQMGGVILTEASLSFLNLGIPPPTVSWGQMLALTGLPYMQEAPWMVLAPGLAITAVVYGVNVLGDALRDVLDPRLRGTS